MPADGCARPFAAAEAVAAAVKSIGANGTTTRRVVAIRAIAVASGRAQVPVVAVADAGVAAPATADATADTAVPTPEATAAANTIRAIAPRGPTVSTRMPQIGRSESRSTLRWHVPRRAIRPKWRATLRIHTPGLAWRARLSQF
jgi:hypothetical protein